jgi:hypothetical protein
VGRGLAPGPLQLRRVAVEYSDITTEELHLCYRICAVIAEQERGEVVTGHVMAAAEELLRIAYRARTEHDPIAGQTAISDF